MQERLDERVDGDGERSAQEVVDDPVADLGREVGLLDVDLLQHRVDERAEGGASGEVGPR